MGQSEPIPWVDGLTIGQVLDRTVSRYPDRDALVFPEFELKWSYARFGEEVERVACGLVALGIEFGDHVAVWAPNLPEWVVLQFAAARVGAVLVNINPAYRPAELRYALQQSDSAALFLARRFRSADYYEILNQVDPDLARRQPGAAGSTFPRLRSIVTLEEEPLPGALGWGDMLERGGSVDTARLEELATRLSPEQAINIQYTSGTTGFPKAAMLSHRNLLLNAYHVGECQKFTEVDRIAIPVPFYHCFGCVMGTLCAAVYGAAMIVPARWFQSTSTLAAIEAERATSIYGVPTMFIAMLQDESFAARKLSSLRTGIMAGSPCPIEIMRQVIDRMGAREMTIAYGQTEASPVITQTRTADPLELRVETVGRPLPGIEVRILDPATGQVLGDNQPGELCARGHGVMLGYYKQPEATAAAIDPEGWLHTGDLALRRPDGNYRITGRIKEMVIRGGENIYPREIEEFLFTHPSIEQAVVVGVPDTRFGEELCVWVKLKAGLELTEEEVRDYCRQNLAHYKTPRYIRFVENFPQTVTGKIQKYKIRERMVTELGLEEQETA